MLPDEMEAEKNRKILIAQADEIEMLKRNVRDLQKQLQDAYIKIGKGETGLLMFFYTFEKLKINM